jgi:hypothetical protein
LLGSEEKAVGGRDIGERSDAVLRTAMLGHDGSASMDDMRQTPEVEKIDAALKRAAYRALHGTREERSGRYLPAKSRKGSTARRTSK